MKEQRRWPVDDEMTARGIYSGAGWGASMQEGMPAVHIMTSVRGTVAAEPRRGRRK